MPPRPDSKRCQGQFLVVPLKLSLTPFFFEASAPKATFATSWQSVVTMQGTKGSLGLPGAIPDKIGPVQIAEPRAS
jgi:hypothetical protein